MNIKFHDVYNAYVMTSTFNFFYLMVEGTLMWRKKEKIYKPIIFFVSIFLMLKF